MTTSASVAVGDMVAPVSSWTPERDDPDGSFTYIDLSAVDQDSKVITGARELLGGEAPSRARQIVRSGDILVSTVRPNLNGVARVPTDLDGATASTGFCVLRPCAEKLDGGYLFHWVRSPYFIGDMVRRATGASYPAISDRIVLDSKLPALPLSEQRRIAEILDKADALRANRRAALIQLDALTQSVFLDMFGDPATNPKGWPRRRISDIATVVTGNTPSRAVAGYYGTDIEWVKSDNINTPQYYLTRAEEGLSDLGKEVARVVPAGSILVTCIAGSPECIGNAAMTNREVAFNQQINALVPRDGDAHFIYVQLLVGKRLVQQASTAAMKGMVNKSRFERIALLWPPLSLQQDFANRVQVVQKLTATERVSLENCDALFASLQHRVFRGEL